MVVVVLIWSKTEGWKSEPTLEPPNSFELGTRGLRIQGLNHYTIETIAPYNVQMSSYKPCEENISTYL